MGSRNALAAAIERDLRAVGTAERARAERAYLKSELVHLGATVPAMTKVTRAAVRGKTLSHPELIATVQALWARGIHELRAAAVELLTMHVELLTPRDVAVLERLLRESRTWALVDELSARVVGALVERHPKLGRTLDRWAKDDDFWMRRSALLALLGPLRRGEGDFERFARYADAMLEEREFFIRKAIGWVLREVGKKRPKLVADWLRPRAARLSGVTLREAVKYLPVTSRDRIVTAQRASRRRASRSSLG